MPTKKRAKKPIAKMTTSGRPLTDMQKEMILQAFALTGSKRETARQIGVSEATVYNVLKAADNSPAELRAARAAATEQLAGKVHAKTAEILESITPEDMESGRIPMYDENGALTGMKSWGPTLLQKVTAVAVLSDKTRVLSELREGLRNATDAQKVGMPAPQDLDAALQQIATKVQRLRILDVQFANNISGDDDLTQKLQDAVIIEQAVSAKAEEYTPAESEVIDEFDG